MPRATLQTARLTLRPVQVRDQADVLAALNDLDVSGWLSVVPYPYTAPDFQQFQTQIAKAGETFAVMDAEGFAGIVGAGRSLGYWFVPRCHGRGYATEAARAVLAEQLTDDPQDITSGYFQGNDRSANVLGKLGFVETGRRPNHCRALGVDRPHVDLRLTYAAFMAALPIEARSPRLAFRSLQSTDAGALHAIVSDWEVVRQLASYPWPPQRDFTATRAQPYPGHGFVWGVFLAADLLGTVAVTDDVLGYMLHRDAWGQGYATEACRAAIAHGFAAGRDHLVAGVWADNAASLGVLTKLGFRITGHDVSLNSARGVEMAGHWLRLDRRDWAQTPA